MMNRSLSILLSGLVLLLALPGEIPAQDAADNLAAMRAKYLENLHALSREYTGQEEILAGKYEKSLQSLEALLTRRGDLDYVLAVKKEIAEFRTRDAAELAPTNQASLRKAQMTYAAEQIRIENEKYTRIASLVKQYHAALERTERRLTSEGDIKNALRYRSERERIHIAAPVEIEEASLPDPEEAEPQLEAWDEEDFGTLRPRRTKFHPDQWEQHLILALGQSIFPFPPGVLQDKTPRLRLFGGAQTEKDGLNLRRGYARADEVREALLTACRESGEMTLEVRLETSDIDQQGPARIVSFSNDSFNRNFTLGQEGNKLNFRLRTSQSDENGMTFAQDFAELQPRQPYHVVITYTPGRLRCWLNGQSVLSTREVVGDFSNWSEQHLLFGNEHTADRNWQGRILSLTLLSRAVPEAWVERAFRHTEFDEPRPDDWGPGPGDKKRRRFLDNF